MFKTALQEPTLRREQIDDVIRDGSADMEWADAIYLSRQGSRVDRTRNDIAAVQEMAHRCADRPGLNIWTGRLDKRPTAAASPSLLSRDAT